MARFWSNVALAKPAWIRRQNPRSMSST